MPSERRDNVSFTTICFANLSCTLIIQPMNGIVSPGRQKAVELTLSLLAKIQVSLVVTSHPSEQMGK